MSYLVPFLKFISGFCRRDLNRDVLLSLGSNHEEEEEDLKWHLTLEKTRADLIFAFLSILETWLTDFFVRRKILTNLPFFASQAPIPLRLSWPRFRRQVVHTHTHVHTYVHDVRRYKFKTDTLCEIDFFSACDFLCFFAPYRALATYKMRAGPKNRPTDGSKLYLRCFVSCISRNGVKNERGERTKGTDFLASNKQIFRRDSNWFLKWRLRKMTVDWGKEETRIYHHRATQSRAFARVLRHELSTHPV